MVEQIATSLGRVKMRLFTFLVGVLVTCAAPPTVADDVLDVGPGHAVSIGDDSDRFMVEKISPEDQHVLVLFRPRKETCTFRRLPGEVSHDKAAA